MKKKEEIKVPKLNLQRCSAANEGTHLELIAADKNGCEVDIGLYPLCSFVSTNEGEILFEIYDRKRIIRFPVKELEKGIEEAKKWVRDEDSI